MENNSDSCNDNNIIREHDFDGNLVYYKNDKTGQETRYYYNFENKLYAVEDNVYGFIDMKKLERQESFRKLMRKNRAIIRNAKRWFH